MSGRRGRGSLRLRLPRVRSHVEHEPRRIVEREELDAVASRQLEHDANRLRVVLGRPDAVHLVARDGPGEGSALEDRGPQVERDAARVAGRRGELELLPADPVREVDRDARVVVGRPGPDRRDSGGSLSARGTPSGCVGAAEGRDPRARPRGPDPAAISSAASRAGSARTGSGRGLRTSAGGGGGGGRRDPPRRGRRAVLARLAPDGAREGRRVRRAEATGARCVRKRRVAIRLVRGPAVERIARPCCLEVGGGRVLAPRGPQQLTDRPLPLVVKPAAGPIAHEGGHRRLRLCERRRPPRPGLRLRGPRRSGRRLAAGARTLRRGTRRRGGGVERRQQEDERERERLAAHASPLSPGAISPSNSWPAEYRPPPPERCPARGTMPGSPTRAGSLARAERYHPVSPTRRCHMG